MRVSAHGDVELAALSVRIGIDNLDPGAPRLLLDGATSVSLPADLVVGVEDRAAVSTQLELHADALRAQYLRGDHRPGRRHRHVVLDGRGLQRSLRSAGDVPPEAGLPGFPVPGWHLLQVHLTTRRGYFVFGRPPFTFATETVFGYTIAVKLPKLVSAPPTDVSAAVCTVTLPGFTLSAA